MKNKWEKLHQQRRYCPKYPHEAVVAWVFRNFPQKKAAKFKILDLGCGAGRHAVFLAEEGYDAWATDLSPSGLMKMHARAREKNVSIRAFLRPADYLHDVPMDFDGIICYSVLHYLPLERIQKAVAEIHRVLKPGGKALIVTRAPNDSRFHGNVPPAEKGMVMTSLSLAEIFGQFVQFKRVRIDRWTFTENGGKFVNDDWHIHVEK